MKNEAWEYALPPSGAPCGKHCERRTMGCKAHCPDWARFEETKKERYQETMNKYIVNCHTADTTEKLRRKKHGRS